MTDKLAEAIANMYATFDWHGELDDRAKVLEAARAYHDLPVVDVDCEIESLTHFLRTTYPNGLRWK